MKKNNFVNVAPRKPRWNYQEIRLTMQAILSPDAFADFSLRNGTTCLLALIFTHSVLQLGDKLL